MAGQEEHTAQTNGADEAVLHTAGQNAGETADSKSPWYVRCGAHPLVPSRLRLARLLALVLTLLAVWGVVLSMEGVDATPGGQLFGLAVLCLVAHIAGHLCTLINLPPLLGMLLAGMLLRNVGAIEFHTEFLKAAAIVRKVALAVILTRAGLSLDGSALRRLSMMVLLLTSVPSVVEATTLMVVTHYLMGLPWLWGLLLGFLMAAVSPAVVIACFFRLQESGYGTGKGIPTLVIAVASLDDVIAVTGFGIVFSIIFSTGSLTMKIIQGPLAIVIGITFGILWGTMARVVPQQKDPHAAPLRTLLVGTGGLLAVLGSEYIGYDAAGPLGCILVAFVACQEWRAQDWSDDNNPVAHHFRMVWAVFQTLLFALIGTEINLLELEPTSVGLGVASIGVALGCRILITVVVAFGGNLDWKEKLFLALAWLPKATVQAALAPVALEMVRTRERPEEIVYAGHVQTLSVVAILLTAPAGAAVITLLGPLLLNKSGKPDCTDMIDIHVQNASNP